MKFLWLILLLLVSCASANDKKVDNELLVYAEEFAKIMGNPDIDARLKKSELYFERLPADTVGHCSNWNITYSVVRIDPVWWVKATPMNKMFVAYHEFTHCFCYELHTEETSGWERYLEKIGFVLGIMKRKGYLADGCPASVMHPKVLNEFCMLYHYNYYIKELKSRCQ